MIRSFRSLLILLVVTNSHGFYLPGLAPVSYCEDVNSSTCKNAIPIFVNRLVSSETLLPYEYNEFDFCPDDSQAGSPTENLGQVLFGERIRPSAYHLKFKQDEKCRTVCSRKYENKPEDIEKLQFLMHGMYFSYENRWIVDNMPMAWCYDTNSQQKFCNPGFPIGCFVGPDGVKHDACQIDNRFNEKNSYYVFNHVDIKILYHQDDVKQISRLVKATITPKSYKQGCEGLPMRIGAEDKNAEITYTYSVTYEQNNNIMWASRWDYILDSVAQTNIQWFSIMNSLVIVLFLSGMVAMITVRSLHRDIARYNQLDNVDDAQEEFGWKLVHGDVFRSPGHPMLLSVLVGVGVQIIVMGFVTLLFACFGFLSPANRGALGTTSILLFVTLASVSGYYSARLYKTLGGEKWKTNVVMTAFFVSSIVFGIFFLMNMILWSKKSSAAIPFSTLVAVLCLWFGISTPLTFIGSYFGYKKMPFEHPVRTNQIPRQIPEQAIYTKPLPCVLMGGILPFGCIFIQLFFILTSIWSHQLYYMFGFLFLVTLILVITCSETTILLCYFHLAAEDYRWWWRSYLTSGCTALYFFVYSINFYFTKLQMEGMASMVLYFGYTSIMFVFVFVFTGTIGFLSCYAFVRKIYSVVKVD